MERWEIGALFAALTVYALIIFVTYESAIASLLER